MELVSVLTWVVGVYCAAGAAVVLPIALLTRNQPAPAGLSRSRQMLMTFAAWPVVVAITTIVGIHFLTSFVRPRV